MKKLLLSFFLLISVNRVLACDLCGCSSGNYFIGPFPQFNKHFVGARYTFRDYHTVINDQPGQYSSDFFQTIDLMAGARIGKSWQVLAFVPFNVNRANTDDGAKEDEGLGDLTVMANYNLLNLLKLNRNNQTVSHQLWIGGGVKAPTGRFEPDTAEKVSSANMQPGSGTFDFILNSSYVLQVNNWGVNSNVNYKFNQSAWNFKFGNRLSATAFMFRSYTFGKTRLSPNLGLLYEYLAHSESGKKQIKDTGGSCLLLGTGLEVRLSDFALGVNGQLPMVQDLSNGQTKSKVRGMVQFSYMF